MIELNDITYLYPDGTPGLNHVSLHLQAGDELYFQLYPRDRRREERKMQRKARREEKRALR